MAGFVQKVKKSSIYTLIGRTWDQVVGLIITWQRQEQTQMEVKTKLWELL